VLQTALDLRDAGFDVHVVADGVSSTRQVRQNARGETDIPTPSMTAGGPGGTASERRKQSFVRDSKLVQTSKTCAFFLKHFSSREKPLYAIIL
jgi:hypothetical protein